VSLLTDVLRSLSDNLWQQNHAATHREHAALIEPLDRFLNNSQSTSPNSNLQREQRIKAADFIDSAERLISTRFWRFSSNAQKPYSMPNYNMEQPEVCWRVLEGSSTRILACWIVNVAAAVELRVGYFADTPLHRQTAPDIESARELAQAWLNALRTKATEERR
jgi:hypothetical protein